MATEGELHTRAHMYTRSRELSRLSYFQMKKLDFERLGNSLPIRSKSWLSGHQRKDLHLGKGQTIS